ncbi:MAG: YkgJ family cysteine cluster protein [Clostridium sp.]|nr:YkgJ family cysteine cluster protein [Clostridium sp.]
MDDRLYDGGEMVKIGCNDCTGCSSCCQGMGESILLDPYDIWQIETNCHTTFADLMADKAEFHVVDGLILPNLKMQGVKEQCGFLDEKGRCGIHAYRPGLCRLFPLGRNYENHKLQYFVLEDACPHNNHTKIKVKKWLDIPEYGRYEKFLLTWHNLRKELQKRMTGEAAAADSAADGSGMDRMKAVNMRFLHIFYEKQYEAEDFYGQFAARLEMIEEMI